MKRTLTLVLTLVLTLALALALTACGSSPSVSSAAPGGQSAGPQAAVSPSPSALIPIKVSEPVRSELWGPYYLAGALGYFEEQGLDVEFVTVQGDMPTAPVLAGEAQFGLYGPEMIVKFNSQGQGTKLLATATDRYPYSLVSKGIKDVKDLKGTTVNAGDSGSSPRQFVRAALSNAQLNSDTDVTYVNIPGSASIAALGSGETSATYVSPTARALALSQGYDLLIDIYNNDVHKALIGSDTYEMYIAFSTDDYIKKNPEIVQKFVNASYQAILWADAHSAEEIIEALKPYFVDSPTLEGAVKEIKKNGLWTADGSFSQSGYDAINRMAINAGMITEAVPRENVVEDSFLLNAQQNIHLD